MAVRVVAQVDVRKKERTRIVKHITYPFSAASIQSERVEVKIRLHAFAEVDSILFHC